MITSICAECEWEDNPTYCHWCKNSKQALYPGFKSKKNKDQQRLDQFMEDNKWNAYIVEQK